MIAGCSIGALVGAAYAGGMSARDIRERAEMLLANRIGAMRYAFGEKRVNPFDLLALKGLASLHVQGETLAGLVLPEELPKLIEDLAIPFKVIATDFDTMEERVIETGSLVKAVAASIAIPGVILGPQYDGHAYVDGGVTNPVPFDHVRQGMDIVVAVDVTGRPREANGKHRSNMELAVGSLLIMFHQVAALRRAGQPAGHLHPPRHRRLLRRRFLPHQGGDRGSAAGQGPAEAGTGKAHQRTGLAPRLEEVPEQRLGSRLADAAVDLGRMMAGGLREEAAAVLDGPHLLVARGKIEPPDAGEGDGARAHGARFKRHMEIAVDEPLGAQACAACADRQQSRHGRSGPSVPACGFRHVARMVPARSATTAPTGTSPRAAAASASAKASSIGSGSFSRIVPHEAIMGYGSR